MNGDVVANSWADLIGGNDLITSIFRTETNITVEGIAWTNTTVNGTPAGAPDCSGWTNDEASGTGRFGRTIATDSAWTDELNESCSTLARLYCFEQR